MPKKNSNLVGRVSSLTREDDVHCSKILINLRLKNKIRYIQLPSVFTQVLHSSTASITLQKRNNRTLTLNIHTSRIKTDETKLDHWALLRPGVGRGRGGRRGSRLCCHRGGCFDAQGCLQTGRGTTNTGGSRSRRGRRHRCRRGLPTGPATLTRRTVGVLVRSAFLSRRFVPRRASGTITGCSGSGGSGAVFGPVRLPGLLDVAASTGGRVGRTVVRACVVVAIVVVGLLSVVGRVVELSAGGSPHHGGVAVGRLVHETVLMALVLDGDQRRQTQQAAQLVTG